MWRENFLLIFDRQKLDVLAKLRKRLFRFVTVYYNNRMFFTRFLLAKSGYFVR